MRICDALKRLVSPATACVGSYLAVGSEVCLGALHQTVWSDGGQLVVPRITSDTAMHFVPLPNPQSIVPGRFAIPTSNQSEPVPLPDIDVIIVPLLGFHRSGWRLGMGGGYYDRYLAQQPQDRVLTIGVAFGLQELSEAAPEPWDQPLDVIVTDCAIIRP